MRPWEQIALYKEGMVKIREALNDGSTKSVIRRIIRETTDKAEAPTVYKCTHCCDTGYEDVRGHCKCRNGCPPR